MIEQLSFDGAPSLTAYFAVINPAASPLAYFDFADDTFKALSHNAMTAVTSGSGGSFQVAGNVTASLTVGKKIRVRGSTGGALDGVYTIAAGSAYSGGHTTINVSGTVPSGTASGTVDLNATPYVAAMENANGGGSGVSTYTASIDLNAINPSTTLGQYSVQPFQQTGSAPVPDSDTAAAGKSSLTIQLGLLGPQEIRVRCQNGVTSTAGTAWQVAVWLECNGVVVNPITVDPNDSGGSNSTAAVTVVQFGQTIGGVPTFTVSTANFGQPTADGRFEYTKTTPGFTPDQQYAAWVTLTVNGNTFAAADPFPVFA